MFKILRVSSAGGISAAASFAALLLLCFSLTGWAKPGGWHDLFDGKSLTGWERKAVHGGNGGLWEVSGKALVGNQEPDHKGGLLGTTALYGDFEIEVEFLADNPVDTGLFLRTAPDGRGYQVTIDNRPDGTIGSLYVPGDGFVAQNPEWPKKFKPGKWNTLRAIVTGPPSSAHVVVFLNGKKTVDYTETKADRLPARGYIGLQVHGGNGSWGDNCRVRFRRVRLREIVGKEQATL